MNLQYKKISDIYEKCDSYVKALSWDTKHTYSLDDNVGSDWLLEKMIGVYNQGELIALGGIKTHYDIENKDNYGDLSLIVKFKYRKKGIAEHLLKELLIYCKELNVDTVRASILRKNKISIEKAEKNNFRLVSNDNKILIYEKKLIIEQ